MFIVYKDRFRSKVDFWVSIGFFFWVFYIICFGYCIFFILWFFRVFFCNNRFVLDYVSFVDSVIFDLFFVGFVIEVFMFFMVVNFLMVFVSFVGKCWFIFDFCYVNKFIFKVKFKMEDSRIFFNYVYLLGYMFKFDMKFGYYYVSIYEEF